MIRLIIGRLADLLFPKICFSCGKEGQWLCPECFDSIGRLVFDGCHHCGRPETSGRFCPDCSSDFCLDGILPAVRYDDDTVKKLIKAFKFHFIKELSIPLGFLLAGKARQFPGFVYSQAGADWVIVPVPLHARRERWRGFNQAELLADVAGAELALPVWKNKLVRRKYGRIQSKLCPADRQKNVRAVFVWEGPEKISQNVFLVDDVATTASTLDACARLLKAQGAQEVWGLVVAKG